MNSAAKITLLALLAATAIGAGTYGAYLLGMRQGMAHGTMAAPATGTAATGTAATGTAATGAAATSVGAGLQPLPQGIAEGEEATRRHIGSGIKAGDVDPLVGRQVLYYHDPMVPGNKFDQPAKSPFMDMMLVPVYAGASGEDQGTVTVSPRVQQNLGVRTAEVVAMRLEPQVSAVGSIVWNERDQVVVQARANGFVEKLLVRASLDRVKAGQVLAELYVPEWIAAQEEYLSLRRMSGVDLAPLVDAARQRMRLAGMSDAQITLVETSGQTQARMQLVAPMSGIVSELLVREGMTVMAGAPLFRIHGTGTVWAQGEVPESQAALLRPGARVLATSPAVPGARFTGRVQAILPEVDNTTRTLKARLELANPGGKLVPGMFVQMQFSDMRAAASLVVPTEAVIQTGTRAVVMLAQGDGRFRAVEVETGLESAGQTEIRRGLQAGQRVVVSSQFLIDSEASLKGVEARLNAEPQVAAPAEIQHQGSGRIEQVGRDAVTLSHGPIPSLKWGPMTMDFLPPAGGLPRGAAPGDRIEFTFGMGSGDTPQLTSLRILAPEPGAPAAGRKGSGR